MSVEASATPQGRLHPWSWLFVLLAQLRSLAVPLIALLVFGGRGDGPRWELYGALGGGALALWSVVQYFTYRYGVIGADLVIRAGVLNRNTRNIPLARIRNVTLHRTLLHRLFGVAEVRLESAGGASAEAQMRVLSLDAAAALERLLQDGAGAGSEAAGQPPRGERLLALPTAELVRLGLISNRGMVVVGAAFAGVWQFTPDGAGDWMEAGGRWLFGQASALQLGFAAGALSVLVLLAMALVLVRLLSIVLAVSQFHGFTLDRQHGTLTVESGLLTRVRSHAPLRKIQLWTVTETLLHRLFARQTVTVETAVAATGEGGARPLQHLAPVAAPAQVATLLRTLSPHPAFPDFDWQPLHVRAWRRLCFWPMLVTVLVTALLAYRTGATALLLLVLLPWWLYRARRVAAAAGWALTDAVVAYRSGWISRQISFAEVGKLQAVQLLHTPFDRRHGMATVVVDTAGAHPFGHRVHIRFLPEPAARALASTLGARIARSPFAW